MSIYINLPSGVAKRALLLFSRHALELAPRDDGPEPLERLFHSVGGLRGRPDEVGVVRLRDSADLLLSVVRAVLEVRLVDGDQHGHPPDDLLDPVDPAHEVDQRAPSRDVGDGEDAAGAVEVRLAQEFLEPRLAHDVPDRQVHARVDILVRHGDLQDLLRHLGAEGRLVAVLERVEDEPPDQRRLSDGEVAHEADFRLQHLGPHAMLHRGPGWPNPVKIPTTKSDRETGCTGRSLSTWRSIWN